MSDTTSYKQTISLMITTAAFSVLALAGASVAVVVPNFKVGLTYWTLVGLSAVCCVTSCVLAGRGIARLRRGNDNGNPYFNAQAIAAIVAFLFLLSSFSVTGDEKEGESLKSIAQVNRELGVLTARLDQLDRVGTKVDEATLTLARLDHEVSRLTERIDTSPRPDRDRATEAVNGSRDRAD